MEPTHAELANKIGALDSDTQRRFGEFAVRLVRLESEQRGMSNQLAEVKETLIPIRNGIETNHSQAAKAISEIKAFQQSASVGFKMLGFLITVGLAVVGFLIERA